MNTLAALKAAAQSVAVETSSEQLPRLGWRNGAKQARQAGYFYIKADHLPLPPEGWQEVTIYDDETGYQLPSLKIAYLGHRAQPFRREQHDGQKYPTNIWLDRWEPGAQLYTEILCMVEGVDTPFVWAVKGMTGKAVAGRGGLLSQHTAFVQRAGTTIGAAFNPWAFWLPITSQHDSKGQPTYTETGFGSWVTLPVLLEHAGDIASRMEALFVGTENYERFTAIYRQYRDQGWFAERRGNQVYEPTPESPPTTFDGDGSHFDEETLPF